MGKRIISYSLTQDKQIMADVLTKGKADHFAQTIAQFMLDEYANPDYNFGRCVADKVEKIDRESGQWVTVENLEAGFVETLKKFQNENIHTHTDANRKQYSVGYKNPSTVTEEVPEVYRLQPVRVSGVGTAFYQHEDGLSIVVTFQIENTLTSAIAQESMPELL